MQDRTLPGTVGTEQQREWTEFNLHRLKVAFAVLDPANAFEVRDSDTGDQDDLPSRIDVTRFIP